MKKKLGLLLATLLVATTSAFVACNSNDGNKGNGTTSSPTENSSVATTYTITYANGNASATGTAPTQAALESGKTFTVAENTFEYAGHAFAGWTDGTKVYKAGDTYTVGDKNVVLTATWQEVSFEAFLMEETVVYNGEEQKPEIVVVWDGSMVDGADYQVDWGNGNYIDAGNYSLKVSYSGVDTTLSYTIQTVQPVVTVDNKTIVYGETPELSYELTGLPEDQELLNIELSVSETPMEGTEDQFAINATATYVAGVNQNNFEKVIVNAGVLTVSYPSLALSDVALKMGLVYQGVDLSEPTYQINKGAYPALSYSVADSGVATVSANGLVTAVSNGATTLTVKAGTKIVKEVTVTVTDYTTWNKIGSKSDFLAMDKTANNVQVTDIDFDGESIAVVDVEGVYEGNGYALKNFASKNVFGSVSGTVQNVEVYGTIVCGATEMVSGIVEVLAGGTLQNVYAELKVYIEGLSGGWPYYLRGLTAGQIQSGYTARNIVLVVDDKDCPLGYAYFSMDGDSVVDVSTITMENIFVYGGTKNIAYDAANFKEYCFRQTAFTSLSDLTTMVQASVENGTMPAIFKANASSVWLESKNFAVVQNAEVYETKTIDLADYVTWGVTPDNVTYTIIQGGEFATLNGSVLTGVAQGTVIVKVSGDGIEKEMTVTVGEYVYDFAFADESVELVLKEYNGQDYGSVKTYNDFTKESADMSYYTFVSDNEAVATVANGVVTAVGNGTATITVKHGDKVITTLSVKVSVWVAVYDVNTFASVSADASYFQVADIDFGGAAITPVAVNGVYDGQGFELKNFVSKNVFGAVSGTVKNIKVQGTIICPADQHSSGIVQQLSGTIENVYAELTADVRGMSPGWPGFTRGMVAGLVFDGYTARNIVAIVGETANTYNYGLFSIDGDRVTDGSTTTMENVYFYAKGNAYFKASDFSAFSHLFNYNLYTEETAFASAVNEAIDAGTLPESFRITPTVWVEISTAEEFLAMEADGNYRQTADIDFGGQAITPVAINGVYDGQGFALKNFESKNVFGEVSGTVKNIKVQGTIICPADQHSSGIVYVLAGGTLENVNAEIKVSIEGLSGGWAYYLRGLVAGQLASGYTARNIVLVVDDSESPFGYGYFSFDGDNPVDASTVTMENILVCGGTKAAAYVSDFKEYCFRYTEYASKSSLALAVNKKVDAGELPESFRMEVLEDTIVWTEISTVEQFLAMDRNGFYKQTADIDFGGQAIAPVAVNGVYDGQGFALKNFASKNVFGVVSGTVKNIKLQGTIVCTSDAVASGIVAQLAGGTLENVNAELKVNIESLSGGWPYYLRGLIAGQLASGYTAKNIVLVVDDSESPFGYGYFSFDGDTVIDVNTITMENILVCGGTKAHAYVSDFKEYCFRYTEYASEAELNAAVQAKVEAGEMPEMFKAE